MSSLPNPLPDVEAQCRQLADLIRPQLSKNPALVGIYSGGAWIAERLKELLGLTEEVGLIDVSFYRDDFSEKGLHPQCRPTVIPFDVEGRHIILVDDVLFLVEAKAGAAATIASPALDFGRHAQSVQDLVLKAYKQSERFFNYLNSADEVSLYHLVDGKYEECGRVRRSDYRVMMPIGLTVESFSPFSAYCKELPQVEPLLGRHAFVSLSIDDLFVLKRLLPTPGEFAHYMEVRQAVAGMRQAHLFDEFDHLGAYLKKNRFDQDIAEQLKGGKVNMLVWDGMSGIVDRSFEGEDWESGPFPTQEFPEEVLKLLGALDATRARGWLSAESHIRDLGEEGRNNLAKMLSDLRQTLNQHPARYFILSGDGEPFFIWLQQHDHQIDWTRVSNKASAAALAVKASNTNKNK